MSKRFLLVLWLTGQCNLQCRYCYASACPAPRHMEFETAKNILDRLRNIPLKIQFAGGEPLLNFALAEQICAYVKEQKTDAVFQMQTNGTLISEQTAKQLAALHISTGVSLDGMPEINALTRGRTAEAVRGIRLLGEEGMVIGLNAVVTSLNVKALPKLVDFAFYLGNVGGIGLDLLRHAGRGAENHAVLDVQPEQLREALTGMYRRSEELFRLSGRRIELREIELAKKRLRSASRQTDYCYASCGRSAVVLPDGSLYPCGSLIDERYHMGSAESFLPGQAVSLHTEVPDHCARCRFEPHCPKGCPSRRIRNENNLDCVLLKTAFELAEQIK